MLPSADDCDDCSPDYVKPHFGPQAAFSTIPFLATFALVTIIAYRRVYPLLSIASSSDKSRASSEPSTQDVVRRIAALTFSSTIALSAVLTELLLCEISNSFNPTARSIALQITVASLLGLLVVAIPILGIHAVGSSYPRPQRKSRIRLQWVLEFVGYVVFLLAFWALGAILPSASIDVATQSNLFQACLDRLGITGVTLMALLSGFASVSAIWQTFGPKSKPVTETDINRKEAGLQATLEMVTEKKSQLRNLERKLSNVPTQGFWSKTVGTFRGNTDAREKQTLEMEISGLETMTSSLDSSLNVLRTRRADELRSTTSLGRLAIGFSLAFSCYCVYRICMATFNLARRVVGRDPYGKADTDPVTYAIALFARNVYPSLDQASWAQQISFLISGAMLLASFSAVTQTFHLFARFMPSVLHATRTNFALLISQISGMYVISSALMLRGMMPEKVGSVINGALGAGLLDPAWIQRWFDGFFMLAVVVTAVGIFLGKQIGGGTWNEDTGWDRDVEMGKRS